MSAAGTPVLVSRGRGRRSRGPSRTPGRRRRLARRVSGVPVIEPGRSGLDEHVVSLASLQRPAGAVSGHVDHNQLRVIAAELLRAEPEPLGRSVAPGATFWTNTSTPAMSDRIAAKPSGALRSTQIDSLPRLSHTKCEASPCTAAS